MFNINQHSFSQEFIFDLMRKADLQIIKLEDAFNSSTNYFEINGKGRETGYKHFQRWYNEKRYHLNENGYIISPKKEWEAYKKNMLSKKNAYVQKNAGSVWTELGPFNSTIASNSAYGQGRLTSIAINPTDESIIYVTSPGGGIWKSTTGGNAWTPLQDYNSEMMDMYSVTIDPNNINILYAGNSSGSVFKSSDAGNSWTTLSVNANNEVRKVIVSPTNSNVVFVCSTNGIHRSSDAGATWVHVVSGSITYYPIEDLEFKPNDTDIITAVGLNTVHRSEDNGITWTELGTANGITGSGRRLVAVTPANPNYVYIVQANGAEFGSMYKSTDGGLSFSTTVTGDASNGTNYFGLSSTASTSGGQALHDMALCVSNTNEEEVYIAGINIWKSTNGATSFTCKAFGSYPNALGYVHADVHGLYWINNTLYTNTDGGIYKTEDNAENWTDLSDGLRIKQFHRMGNSQTNENVISAGSQDCGSVIRRADGNWLEWKGGDGMEQVISPTNHLKVYGMSQNGALDLSLNGGTTRTGSGTSWTLLLDVDSNIEDIAVAPSDPNYIYVANSKTIYTTIDGGITWKSRNLQTTIVDLAVDRNDPKKCYIVTGSTNTHLRVTSDASSTFQTYSTSSLSGLSSRSIALEDNDEEGIYLGFNTGVYYINNTMTDWVDYTDNLPVVAITELEIQYESEKLRVATYGRGIWEAPLIDTTTTLSSSEIETVNDYVSLYPNPFSDTFNIILNNPNNSTIEIFNNLGELIFSQKTNKKEIKIDLTDKAKGIYLLKITTGNQISTKKIIKN